MALNFCEVSYFHMTKQKMYFAKNKYLPEDFLVNFTFSISNI